MLLTSALQDAVLSAAYISEDIKDFCEAEGGVYQVRSQLWKHFTHIRSSHRAHPEPDYIICATIYLISPCSSSSPKSFLTRWLQLSGSAYINLKLNPTFCLIIASAILEYFLYAWHNKPASICSWFCPTLTPTKLLFSNIRPARKRPSSCLGN